MLFLCSPPVFYISGKWARRKNLVWWKDLWLIFSRYKFLQTFFWLDCYSNFKQYLLWVMIAIKNRKRQLWINRGPSSFKRTKQQQKTFQFGLIKISQIKHFYLQITYHFVFSQMLAFGNHQNHPYCSSWDLYFSWSFKLGTYKQLSVEVQSHCYYCNCTMEPSSLASGSEAREPPQCRWTLFRAQSCLGDL